MRDDHEARSRLDDVAVAGAALPPEWSWDPPATFSRDDWVPRRLKTWEARRSVEAFEWRGITAKWGAESVAFPPGMYVAKRNGRVVRGSNKQPRYFPSLDAVKTYCRERDRR
jgi:hypothetical protein